MFNKKPITKQIITKDKYRKKSTIISILWTIPLYFFILPDFWRKTAAHLEAVLLSIRHYTKQRYSG